MLLTRVAVSVRIGLVTFLVVFLLEGLRRLLLLSGRGCLPGVLTLLRFGRDPLVAAFGAAFLDAVAFFRSFLRGFLAGFRLLADAAGFRVFLAVDFLAVPVMMTVLCANGFWSCIIRWRWFFLRSHHRRHPLGQ